MTKIKIPTIRENEDLKKEFSYPEELEFNLNRPLGIGVQGPYEFMVLDEKTYIISTTYKEKIINEGKNKKEDIRVQIARTSHMYDPFEKFNIEFFINTIMSINPKNKNSVLEFYNSYGPLGFDGMGTSQGEINANSTRTFGLLLNTNYESLIIFKQEITQLQHFIQIYEALQNKDDVFLRNFEELPKYSYSSNSGENLKEITREKLYSLAKRSILFAINSKSHLINPVVGLIDGEISKFTTATCLLGVFYLRFYELVTDNPKIKRCRYCGDYFIPRKTNANFCPPPEANERSKCANRYDAMVRRIAEWHYKEGLSLEEIQIKLTKPKTRSIREIQYILDNYKGKLKK